ncbi:MAG: NADH-quinone oxidoreductase subunit NuoF [Oligoflexia bacterium]|nr:NADH-quinone oxidoreductase subunit NuoF [Oligoflexia bacterium]
MSLNLNKKIKDTNNNSKLEIIVGEGTCGVAAGAKEVLQVIESMVASNSTASTTTIRTVGCKGICHQEVVVEIKESNGKHFIYGKLNKKNVESVIKYHLGAIGISGVGESCEQPKDLLIYSSLDPENKTGDYLRKQTRIALRNVGEVDPTSIDDYIARGGYKAIRMILEKKMSSDDVVAEVKDAGLKGRGGGGFPTATKWLFARNEKAEKKYLVCNGDEGDPGAFMDRSLLEGDPHSVLEGMLIAAYAIGATDGYAYIRAEYPLAVQNFGKAIKDAKKLGFVGKKILGSNFSFELKIKQGAGAFVCGEETALIASIEGQRGMPRIRPPFPAIKGAFGKPTIVNNVETLANLPWIIVNSGAEYAKYGTANARGTKVFALAGAIARGGLVEVPMGMTIREVIFGIGGGSKTGRPIKAVQLGGPSGGCVPESLFDTTIEYDTINATGAIMGSGGMIVMDDKTCMVDLARYFLEFTQVESCGKCTFCRIGTLRMKELLTKICEGQGNMDDLVSLERLANQVKLSSLCGLGQTAPNPVLTTLKYFKDEYLEHIHDKKCRATVCKKLITHSILKEKCIACDLCRKACPVSAISGTQKERGSYSIDSKVCVNCGLCLDTCRVKAIKVE